MSRGGWILIIGGVVLLVGIGLFSFATASFLPELVGDFTTLSPGAFQNRTVNVGEAGSAVTYLVGIPEPTAGDEVTVFIQTPSDGEVQRTTVDSANPPPVLYFTTERGLHIVVIQNTAEQSLGISYAATEITLPTLTLLAAGTYLGFGGFLVLIVGLGFWIFDRRRRRRQPLEMPPPPS